MNVKSHYRIGRVDLNGEKRAFQTITENSGKENHNDVWTGLLREMDAEDIMLIYINEKITVL